MSASGQTSDWDSYYKATKARPPRELLWHTLTRFDPPVSHSLCAIDLGCGAGVESLEMLRRGWRVVAIDRERAATQQLVERAAAEYGERLEVRAGEFGTVEIPEADLIWAGNCLPFCPPEFFNRLWRQIVSALRPGGRFAGDFFGVRHGWMGRDGMSFHTEEEVRELFRPFELEYFISEEGIRRIASGRMQAWHAFSAIGLKQ